MTTPPLHEFVRTACETIWGETPSEIKVKSESTVGDCVHVVVTYPLSVVDFEDTYDKVLHLFSRLQSYPGCRGVLEHRAMAKGTSISIFLDADVSLRMSVLDTYGVNEVWIK